MKLLVILLGVATALFAQAPGRQKRTVTDTEVLRVHKSTLLIDTHNDVTSATVAGLDLGKPNTDHMTDIPRMKKGGMGAQIFAVYVAASYVDGNHAANRAMQMIDTVRHDIIEQHPGDFAFAAVLTAVVTLAATAFALVVVLRLIQCFLNWRRMAAWEAAWRAIGPRWTGHRS